ncbi:MAG: hypothetical protein Q7R89_00655 [bacterium]|nr:hypothetical protein [bacterium]
MRHDKKEATILRKNGLSYREIIKKLGIPRATLSDWFRNEEWSKRLKHTLSKKSFELSRSRMIRLDKIRGKNLIRVYEQAREGARKDFEILKHHPLFVAGVMTYWGEGDKASKRGFRVTNSDPLIMRIFLLFLRKICSNDENRIRAWILIYPDLDAEKCESYWSVQLGLSRKNFTKSITIKGRHKTRRVSNGICTLSYSSRFLKEKMLVWMSLMAKDLLQNKAGMV